MNIKMGYPEFITKYNVPKDCCCHQFCDIKATQFVTIHIGKNLPLHLVFCEEHAEEYLSARRKEKNPGKEALKQVILSSNKG